MVGELTHMRSMCVGVAETGGINTYAKHVCWRRRDAGMNHLKKYQLQKGMKSVGFHALVKIPFYLLRMNAAMMLSIPKRIKYAATK